MINGIMLVMNWVESDLGFQSPAAFSGRAVGLNYQGWLEFGLVPIPRCQAPSGELTNSFGVLRQ
jgi:hypothetical protein